MVKPFWKYLPKSDKYRIVQPPRDPVKFTDEEVKYCCICNRRFSTVEAYREHHYKGKCGGYL